MVVACSRTRGQLRKIHLFYFLNEGEKEMKKLFLFAIPCLLVGTGIFFMVNHAARAQLIVATAGELPYIPGCPLHESCVNALLEEQTLIAPLFPAVYSGGIAGMGAAVFMGVAFLLIAGRKRQYATAI
jgi:hypothetical protein